MSEFNEMVNNKEKLTNMLYDKFESLFDNVEAKALVKLVISESFEVGYGEGSFAVIKKLLVKLKEDNK